MPFNELKLIKLLVIPLFALASQACAQDLASVFEKLSRAEIIWEGSTAPSRPGDGRPWVVVIFKACCPTNRRAIRWALQMEKDFKDRVGFLGINSDYARARSKVEPWLSANKVDFAVFQDPSHEVINALHIMAVPTIIILDAEGNEDFTSAGFFGGSGNVIRERLEKLLSNGGKTAGGQDGK